MTFKYESDIIKKHLDCLDDRVYWENILFLDHFKKYSLADFPMLKRYIMNMKNNKNMNNNQQLKEEMQRILQEMFKLEKIYESMFEEEYGTDEDEWLNDILENDKRSDN